MQKNKVLIITHAADNASVDTVAAAIADLGGEVIRFDVDQYPVQAQLSSTFTREGIHLDLNGQSLDGLTAVWYRRSYNIGKGLDKILEKAYLSSTLGELRRTLFGMLEGLPCFQLERYSVYRRLDSKEEQLRIARQCGLAVPDTCITNSPAVLQEFMRKLGRPVIAKMQSAFAIYDQGDEQVVFTNEIQEEHLSGLAQLQYCPMTFQEKLEKALELRVTLVGKAVFAFSIDSQRLPGAQTDWRKEGAALAAHWQVYDLPENVKASLLRLMAVYGINYGAVDLILTPGGEYYFLEVNAAGEFFWLDQLCGYGISAQLAAVLLGTAERNGQ